MVSVRGALAWPEEREEEEEEEEDIPERGAEREAPPPPPPLLSPPLLLMVVDVTRLGRATQHHRTPQNTTEHRRIKSIRSNNIK